MRGVFTAGALCALEELGLRSIFDAVYGSSAGAVNASYFLSGQVTLGTSIYYSDINNRNFIDWRRILRGTAVDIDFCYEEVVGRRKRLAMEQVLASSTRLHVYVTNVERARTECFTQNEMDGPRDLLTLLKASGAMPLVYRRPIVHRGSRYVDGALFLPVPILEAIADGCSDVLVLLSRPLASAETTPQSFLMPLVWRTIDHRRAGALAASYAAGMARLHEGLRLLRAGRHERGEEARLAVVAPPPDLPVTRWTTDRQRLIAAAESGVQRTLTLFGVAEGAVAPRAVLGPLAA